MPDGEGECQGLRKGGSVPIWPILEESFSFLFLPASRGGKRMRKRKENDLLKPAELEHH
jgi:hypothetical protein